MDNTENVVDQSTVENTDAVQETAQETTETTTQTEEVQEQVVVEDPKPAQEETNEPIAKEEASVETEQAEPGSAEEFYKTNAEDLTEQKLIDYIENLKENNPERYEQKKAELEEKLQELRNK